MATVRMRMMVERSPCHASAASATVSSCRTSCRKISYFCEALKKRLAEPSRSVGSSVLIGHGEMVLHGSSTGRGDLRLLSDQPANL